MRYVLIFSLICFSKCMFGQISNIPSCSTDESSIFESQNKGTGYCDNCNLWPFGIVGYTFSSNVSVLQRQIMLEAMAILESISAVRFVEKESWPTIYIKDSNENSASNIGMTVGYLDLKITSWNNKMIIIHELAHALGFYHEQSRKDRDRFVRINWGNICNDFSHNFDKKDVGSTNNIPYDFESIMHYGSYAFSKCSDPTDKCKDNCGTGQSQDYVGKRLKSSLNLLNLNRKLEIDIPLVKETV